MRAPGRREPTRLALETIAAVSLEIIQGQVHRDSAQPDISGLLADLAYVCMAPFLGARAANEAIEGLIAAEGAGGER